MCNKKLGRLLNNNDHNYIQVSNGPSNKKKKKRKKKSKQTNREGQAEQPQVCGHVIVMHVISHVTCCREVEVRRTWML